MTQEERELSIKKPGTRIPKHARVENIEVFNKFIDRIIPYHAAPFFIFDGEEIKDVILRQNSQEMQEAIHKISGMEAYKQLLEDLNSLKLSLENKIARLISHKAINDLKEKLDNINQTIDELKEKDSDFKNKIRHYEKLINEARLEREKKVIQNSKSREAIVRKQTTFLTELEITRKDLKEFVNENLLGLILKEKISDLQKQIKLEKDISQRRILKNASLAPYRSFINQLLSKNISPPLTKEQLDQIREIGEKIWIEENKIRTSDIPDNFMEINDISKNDYNFIVNFPLKDKSQLAALINKVDRLNQDIQLLEKEIRNAPEATDIENENNKIDLLVKKLGELQLKYRVVTKKLNTADEEKTRLMNHISRMSGQDENVEDLKSQLENVNNTLIGMRQYVQELTFIKANYIREEFEIMLQKLFRKKDEFGKIEFDINTYTVRLFNDKMQEISIHDRSAGEMQMISSAFIWALTKASDLLLPMVIDTPLGRLDSYHRNHLINHYYKELSDQVIILSTDTEITEEYINLMEKNSYKPKLRK